MGKASTTRRVKQACCLCAVLVWLFAGRPSRADDAATPEALVVKLGDAAFAAREKAEQDLVALGSNAKAALLAGVSSADVDVSRRCRRIVRAVLERDLVQRVTRFESGDQQETSLPGWSRFADVVGTDAAARALYVQMLKLETGLFLACDAGADELLTTLRYRIQQFMQAQNHQDPNRRRQPMPLATLALLYQATDPRITLTLNLNEQSYLRSWLYQGELQNLVKAANTNGPATKILVEWVRSGATNGAQPVDRLSEAILFELADALPLALEALRKDKVSLYAVEIVARVGGKDYVEALLPALKDQTKVATFQFNNKAASIETRDIALAWIVYFTGQDLKQYSFTQAAEWFKQIKQNRTLNVSAYRFTNEEDREKAHQKLTDWLKTHPLRPFPVPLPEERGVRSTAIAAPVKPITEPTDPNAEDDEAKTLGLNFAESFELQRLNRARQMIRDERFAEAAILLAELVRQSSEKWFQPQRGVPQFRELRAEAERLIASLPPEGFDAIEKQFGAVARQMLDAARDAGSTAELLTVSRLYFATKAGTEATYLLAEMDLDAGRVLDAAMHFERLATASRQQDIYEPKLSLKRALCWSRLGEIRHAKRVLDELRADYPDLQVSAEPYRLFGEPGTNSDQTLRWLKSVGKTPATSIGWPTHRGQLDRNAESSSITPWLDGVPLVPVVTSAPLESLVRDIAKEVSTNRLGRIPSLQPLVVGETIVLRTATDLRAVNLNGELRWSAPQEDTLWFLMQPAHEAQRNSQQALLPDFLRDRLWDDSTFGTLSSDGRLVFAVEGDRFEVTPDYQRFTVGPDGRLRLGMSVADRGNALVAYDITSGKVVWESGQSLTSTDGHRRTIRYLGAPLSFGGALFVVAVQGDEIGLHELDADSGSIRRQWPLQTEMQPATNVMWGMRNNRMKTTDNPAASSPSYVNGVIVCRTPGNRIVAIDLTTGSLRWAYQTPRPEGPAVSPFNPMVRINGEAQRRMSIDRWCDASLIVADGSVLAALPETNVLTCLELESGAVRWTKPRLDGLYVQGAQNGNVLVVGRTGLRAYKLSDGSPAWPVEQVDWPAAAVPTGMGYLMSGRCATPLSSGEVVTIEIATGRISARSRSANDQLIPGNLVVSAEQIYSLGLDGLRRLKSVEKVVEQLAKSPTDARSIPQRLEFAHALQSAGRASQAVDELLEVMQLEGTTDTKGKSRLVSLLTDASSLSAKDRERVFELLGAKSFATDQQLLIALNTVLAYEQEGQPAVAIDRLIGLQKSFGSHPSFANPLNLRRESASWSVRLDRWTQSKLALLPTRLTANEQTIFDQRVRDLRISQTPADFLACFGHFGSLAPAARFDCAKELVDKDQFGEAELVLRAGVDVAHTDQQGELFLKLLKTVGPVAGRRAEHWLRELKERNAGDDIDGGAGGLNLLARSIKNSSRGIAQTEGLAWPEIKPQQQAEVPNTPTSQLQGFTYQTMIPVQRQQPEIDAQYWLGYEQVKRKWHLLDESGRVRGELSGDTALNSSSFQQGLPQARQVGPALFLWTGMSVHAFEIGEDEHKSLWSIQLNDNNNQNWQSRLIVRRINRMPGAFGARGGTRQETRWWPLVAQPTYVCYQRGRELQAVEPLTGRLLWKRDDDAVFDCDIVGDETTVCAIDSETGMTRIMDAIDGRLLARRQLPPRQQWLSFVDRHLVLIDEATQDVRSIDLKLDRENWVLPKPGRVFQINETDLATLDAQGRFAIIDLRTGRETFNSQVQLAAAKLEDVVVLESFDRYLVFACLPSEQPAGFMPFYRGQVVVNGPCFAINRRTGKTDWTRQIGDQVIAMSRPSSLPVMVAYRSIQETVPAANGPGVTINQKFQVQIINTRNGDLEFEETGLGFFQPMLALNLPKHTVEFRGRAKQLRLDFSNR